MIYYLMFFALGIFIDYKDLKNSKQKADIVFYIIAMILALGFAVWYYINPNRMGISEYLIKLLGLGGI